MSRTIRFAAALLVLASLTTGSLGALPPGSHTLSIESGGGDFLSALAEWVVALFASDRPTADVPEPPPQTKDSSSLDPHGGPH